MPEFDPHGLSRRSSNTDLSWRDDAERSDEFRSAVTTYLGRDFCLRRARLLQNPLIRNAWGELGHVDDLMAATSQALHHGAVDPFTGDQVHADLALSG